MEDIYELVNSCKSPTQIIKDYVQSLDIQHTIRVNRRPLSAFIDIALTDPRLEQESIHHTLETIQLQLTVFRDWIDVHNLDVLEKRLTLHFNGEKCLDIINKIVYGEFLEPFTGYQALGKRLIIEYSQPNTHKEFHIGHLRNTALGDCLCRINRFAGNHVIAMNYYGDQGYHVAVCLWQLRYHIQQGESVVESAQFLGKMYSEGIERLDLASLSAFPIKGARIAVIVQTYHTDNDIIVQIESIDQNGNSITMNSVIDDDTVVIQGKLVAYLKAGMKLGSRRIKRYKHNGVSIDAYILRKVDVGIDDSNTKEILDISDISDNANLGQSLSSLGSFDQTMDIDSILESRLIEVRKIQEDLETYRNEDLVDIWQQTRQWSINSFNRIYHWLGSHFDVEISESEITKESKDFIDEIKVQECITLEKDGCIGVNLQQWKLGFFILLRSNGSAMYSTKDLGLAYRKFHDYGHIDSCIYIVDKSQSFYFRQLFKTLELLLNSEISAKCKHLAYGLVSLPDGKMSSRKGNIVSFSELQKELIYQLDEKHMMKHRGPECRCREPWDEKQIHEVCESLCKASMRFGILKIRANTDFVFNLEEWVSGKESTGIYVIHAYTRCLNVLQRCPDGYEGVFSSEFQQQYVVNANIEDLFDDKISDITGFLVEMMEFRSVIHKCVKTSQPHLLCNLLSLISKQFFRISTDKNYVLKAPTLKQSTRRILYTAIEKFLKAGLLLLGIDPPDRI